MFRAGATVEHNAHQVVLTKEADFANQEVIRNSSVQVATVEHNAHQVVLTKEVDSAKQDNL